MRELNFIVVQFSLNVLFFSFRPNSYNGIVPFKEHFLMVLIISTTDETINFNFSHLQVLRKGLPLGGEPPCGTVEPSEIGNLIFQTPLCNRGTLAPLPHFQPSKKIIGEEKFRYFFKIPTKKGCRTNQVVKLFVIYTLQAQEKEYGFHLVRSQPLGQQKFPGWIANFERFDAFKME